MRDEKLCRLCERITAETDSPTLTQLIDELTKHLQLEQAAIRETIQRNINGKAAAEY